MRFRFRVRALMLLVAAVGLVAGVAVHRSRWYRQPRSHDDHGGGISGYATLTADGLTVEACSYYFGRTAAACPIRWKVLVFRDGETVFEQEYGTLSEVEPGGIDSLQRHHVGMNSRSTITYDRLIGQRSPGVIYRSDLRETLKLQLRPGTYYVDVEARDGLKVRDKTGKIVNRNMVLGSVGSVCQQVNVD